jgi:formate C-acetyltransferase
LVDAEVFAGLEDAIKNPDKYPQLTIRTPERQRVVISRTFPGQI